jgi:hypothetical protein
MKADSFQLDDSLYPIIQATSDGALFGIRHERDAFPRVAFRDFHAGSVTLYSFDHGAYLPERHLTVAVFKMLPDESRPTTLMEFIISSMNRQSTGPYPGIVAYYRPDSRGAYALAQCTPVDPKGAHFRSATPSMTTEPVQGLEMVAFQEFILVSDPRGSFKAQTTVSSPDAAALRMTMQSKTDWVSVRGMQPVVAYSSHID